MKKLNIFILLTLLVVSGSVNAQKGLEKRAEKQKKEVSEQGKQQKGKIETMHKTQEVELKLVNNQLKD